MTLPLDQYPVTGQWSSREFDRFPDDNRRRELLEGSLILRAAPSASHQGLVMRLMVALDDSCPPSLVAIQGMPVRFTPDTILVPDVVVVRAGRTTLSSTSFRGIPSFWRLEVTGGLAVHAYRLDAPGEGYQLTGACTEVVTLDEPWHITLPLARLRRRRAVPPTTPTEDG